MILACTDATGIRVRFTSGAEDYIWVEHNPPPNMPRISTARRVERFYNLKQGSVGVVKLLPREGKDGRSKVSDS